ncbi:S35B4 protein, partial [Tyrannus savana]|nr:S35B4 protein [Tyrannus savana]
FPGPCFTLPFLFHVLRRFPGCGNIVTFSQFLFIAVEGFIFEANFGRKSPAIPIRYYVVMVAMFFTVSVVNNYALNLNISMPLHMIFRSGSLIASMALGIIILKKRYSVSKYTSIALVSLGIFTCTFMSAKQVASDSSLNKEDGLQAFLWWLLGGFSRGWEVGMGSHHPSDPQGLCSLPQHALPLPGFLLLAPDIYRHAVLFSQSEPFRVPLLGLTVPIMWFYLLMNVLTQYVCIRGVFTLTTECPSLTVTLVVTLRKFLSLILSILYFQNPFTAWHWAGTALVFLGTLLYSEIWSGIGAIRARGRAKEH